MKQGDIVTIRVTFLDGEQANLDLQLEEYFPYEPAAYVIDPGWIGYFEDKEYYIGASGQIEILVNHENEPSDSFVKIGTYEFIDPDYCLDCGRMRRRCLCH
jgi:hypothetical protein